jgi:hypothetical protein
LRTIKYIIIFLFLPVLIQNISAQDTTKAKTKPKTDTTYKPARFLLSEYKFSYINQTNPDTTTRRRFLWHPLKNLEDVFNYLPGYYLNYMDVGQLNPVSFNQMGNNAVLRRGRLLNDLYDGSVDYNLFSRNEISEIELTGGFGNFIYNFSNAVNVIDRQIYQNRPYTEISFFQDRYENLYFDGNYHQNYFRNFNFNVGITKHSYDGKYPNSNFDKWLGRFNFNFAANNNLSFFLYSNYAKIQKGLNGGVDPDTVNIGSREDMFNVSKAIVRNTDAYDKKERFDIDGGAAFLIGKYSFSKVQLFVSNSFREFRDEENRPNPNGTFIQANRHWINYGLKLHQVFNFKIAKKFDIISRSEGEYNDVRINEGTIVKLGPTFSDTNYIYNSKYSKINYFSDLLVGYKGVSLEGYVKGRIDNSFEYITYTSGIKAAYTYNIDSLKSIGAYAHFSAYNNYAAGGVNFKFNNIYLSTDFYNYKSNRDYATILQGNSQDDEDNINGMNVMARLRVYKIDLALNYSVNFTLLSDFFPKHFGTADLSFHDVAFKNKFEYKIGITSRGWTKHKAKVYSAWFNALFEIYGSSSPPVVSIPSNATLDFYIIGKIGRATFGLTFENILDRLVYNTGVYPFMDRGGLFNTISRFNITWNFFD